MLSPLLIFAPVAFISKVYHISTGDVNPCTARLLAGIYCDKRSAAAPVSCDEQPVDLNSYYKKHRSVLFY
jgi:hypothetical protein